MVFSSDRFQFHQGDAIAILSHLPKNSVQCVLKSSPYFYFCDYKHEGQHGLEPTYKEFIETQMAVLNAEYQVLEDGGISALNLGDTSNNYSPVRAKGQRRISGAWKSRRPLQQGFIEGEDLSIPWRMAIAAHEHTGYKYLGYRIWVKTGSGGDRVTTLGKADGEPILFFCKQSKGRRLHPAYLKPFDSMFLYHTPTHDEIHPCPYPVSLAQEILEHIAPANSTVLDPYMGSGSTAIAAWTLGMNAIGIDLDCNRAISRCSNQKELEQYLPSPQLSLFG